MLFFYKIEKDVTKCPKGCHECEKHWPGITQKFNGAKHFILTETQMKSFNGYFDWAFNLCPGDGENEAISRKIICEENMPNAEEL